MDHRGRRTRILFVEDEFADEYEGLPRAGRRALRLYAQHTEADGIARLTQAELAERLGLTRMGVKEGVDALVERGFVSVVGPGRVVVNDQKYGSCFHRRPPPLSSPELEERKTAAAETKRRKQLAGRAAYLRRVSAAERVVIDPADVPDWPRPDA